MASITYFFKMFFFAFSCFTFVYSSQNGTIKKSTIKEYSLVNPDTLFVELVLVNDRQIFAMNNNSVSNVVKWNQQLVAEVNSLYRELNLMVNLVDVVVWTEKNEIKISSNAETLLTNFLNYRKEKVAKRVKHDFAILITDVKFDNNLDGKVTKAAICKSDFAGAVVRFDGTHPSFSVLLAHELGHSFGMNHDTSRCKCSSKSSCVMSGRIDNTKDWSDCSINFIESMRNTLNFGCLTDKPQFVHRVQPFCGNGLLEESEECDCDQEVCKECCDSNCKFTTGAVCATGTCCNLKKCNLMKSGNICRQAKNECDLEEYCDGKSEFCPADKFVPNGTPCKDNFCFDGKCNSKTEQCKQLWGPESIPGNDLCYRLNTRGVKTGNCGFDQETKQFKRCNQSDRKCGLLQCTNINEKVIESQPTTYWSIKNLRGRKLTTCYSAGFGDTFPQNPGFVANGNNCGVNQMCINQKCVHINSTLIR